MKVEYNEYVPIRTKNYEEIRGRRKRVLKKMINLGVRSMHQ